MGFSVTGLWRGDTAAGSASFGLGFLSFIYANVARFKKFKGLGFEAELWEDKKKEADQLIERLKEVTSIYTRQIILSAVNVGRATDGSWRDRWKLYDDLVQQHDALGLKIEFGPLKKEIDDYFLFDLVTPHLTRCQLAIQNSTMLAHGVLTRKYGNPITDIEGYNVDIENLRSIKISVYNPFSISCRENLADHVLTLVTDARDRLSSGFGITLEIDKMTLDRLADISLLYNSRPVKVTEELIAWADLPT